MLLFTNSESYFIQLVFQLYYLTSKFGYLHSSSMNITLPNKFFFSQSSNSIPSRHLVFINLSHSLHISCITMGISKKSIHLIQSLLPSLRHLLVPLIFFYSPFWLLISCEHLICRLFFLTFTFNSKEEKSQFSSIMYSLDGLSRMLWWNVL